MEWVLQLVGNRRRRPIPKFRRDGKGRLMRPRQTSAEEDTRKVAAAVIFVASYLALAIGKIPGLSIDRAGVALVGAGLMVASGVLSLEDAYKAI